MEEIRSIKNGRKQTIRDLFIDQIDTEVHSERHMESV